MVRNQHCREGHKRTEVSVNSVHLLVRCYPESLSEARKALDDAMKQLKADGIGLVGASLVVTKDDLEFIKLEQKQER